MEKITERKIIELLHTNKDLSWKDIIYMIVKEYSMDPWDLDVSILALEYLNMIRKFKELDLQLSGEIILTAALLLKIKSKKLINEDLVDFESLLMQPNENLLEENILEYEMNIPNEETNNQFIESIPIIKEKIPKARRRKISLKELIDALERALSIKKKHRKSKNKESIKLEKREFNIKELIERVYNAILSVYQKIKRNFVKFEEILPSNSKEDIVYTFIPLLHLDNDGKINLYQEKLFGDIKIFIKEKNMFVKENQQSK